MRGGFQSSLPSLRLNIVTKSVTDCPDFSDIKILYLKNTAKASVEMHIAEEWGQRKYQTEQVDTRCAVVLFISLLVKSQYDWDGGR